MAGIAMAAPASPSGSETSTIGFSIENLLFELGGGSPLSVVGASAYLGATGSPLSAAAGWLEQLNSGGPMPPRAELIGLLSGLLQAQVAPVLATTSLAVPDLASNGLDAARLVLDPNVRAATGPNPTAPNPNPNPNPDPNPKPNQALTCFPHVVEIDGAPVRLREEKFMRTLTATKREAEEAEWATAVRDEDSQWQQCATKMTRFGLQLVDGHGAPIHGSTLQQVLPNRTASSSGFTRNPGPEPRATSHEPRAPNPEPRA